MTLRKQVIDAIECLKSCIDDENRKLKEFNYLDDFERGAIFGRTDGYEKAIELLKYVLEGK